MHIPKKRIVYGILIAPLSTIFASALWFSIMGIFEFKNLDLLSGFLFGVGVGIIGTLIIAYPATIILCLSLFFLLRSKPERLTWQVYVLSGVIATIFVGNTELLEDGFGPAYLMSAASCSWVFWRIAIYPSKHNSAHNDSTICD